jgi:hypothetical protein
MAERRQEHPEGQPEPLRISRVDLACRSPAGRRPSLDSGRPGIGDQKLYRVLTEELKFDYLIRFRGNIKVTAADGETRMAIDWVGQRGRTRILRGAAVTAESHLVGAVVCVQAKDMKEPWCLATSLNDEKVGILLKKYSKRWGIECSFRDTKDPHLVWAWGRSASTHRNAAIACGCSMLSRSPC